MFVGVAARIDQPVRMKDEIAHVGVVHRRLGPGLPRLARLFVVREGADELDLGQVAEHRGVEVAQLAADDEVQQLGSFGFGGLGHGASGGRRA